MSDDELRRRLDRLAHEAPTPDPRRATTVRAARRRARVGTAIAGATGVAVVVLAVLAVNVVLDRTPAPDPPVIGPSPSGTVLPASPQPPTPLPEPTGTIAFWSASLEGGDSQMTVIEADGSGEQTIGNLSISTSRLSLSPDGREAVFDHGIGPGEGALEVMNFKTGHVRTIFSGSTNSPDWSPDGKQIVFHTQFAELFTMPASGASAGTPLRELAPGDYLQGLYPVWSPDGSQIAYIDSRSAEVRVVSVGGLDPPITLYSKGRAFSLDWGPSGLFVSASSARAAWITRVDPSSGESVRLPEVEDGFDPAISPDGRAVAFVGNDRDGQQDLYVMRLADGEITRLTNDPGQEFSPVWFPPS